MQNTYSTYSSQQPSIRTWANQTLQQQSPAAAKRLQQHKATKRQGRWLERLAAVLALTTVVMAIEFEQQVHGAFTSELNQNMTNWLDAVTLSLPDNERDAS